MLIVALPFVSVAAAEVYLPLVNATEPVGVGLPLPPLTATVTISDCTMVMLDEDGVSVNAAVACVTVTGEDVPVALL